MMIRQYFQQAWAQLRQQPLISAVTVAGTALSIFLIMLVVMMQQVKVAPFSPESNRDRFLHVKWGSITNEAWGESTSNGPLSVRTAREVYGKMTTPEAVTIYSVFSKSRPVSLPGQPAISVDVRETDNQFWTVFDFVFIDGKPYDQATFDAGQPVAVIPTCSGHHRKCGAAPVQNDPCDRKGVLVGSCALSGVWGGERCLYFGRDRLWSSMDSLYIDRPGKQYLERRFDGICQLYPVGT